MKKVFVFIAAAAALCSCGQKSNGYKLAGAIEGDAQQVFIMSGRTVLDSVAVNGGKFTYVCDSANLAQFIVADNKNANAANFRATYYAEPGKINVAFDTEDSVYVAKGTPANDAIASFNKESEKILEPYYNRENPEEVREAAVDAYYDLMKTYVDNNLDNVAGLTYLNSIAGSIIEGEELIAKYEAFSDAVKATTAWQKNYATHKKKVDILTGTYIDFAQPSIADENVQISLKSVVENPANKYVLLDFWASWCGPCMGEIPYLVETYASFHDKGFEIFGSSLDSNGDNWKKSVADKKMNWVHVSDLKYWDNAAAVEYGVRAIPANFLIDCATGKIIAHDLRGADVQKKITELLGE